MRTIRRRWIVTGARVVIASDVGAKGRTFRERVAAYGLAVGNEYYWGGRLPGFDQSGPAGERYAALEPLRAAADSQVPTTLAIDNLGVVNTLKKLQSLADTTAATQAHSPLVVGLCAPCWQWEALTILREKPDICIGWVPSHGKYLEWTPLAPFQALSEEWRAANDVADTEASKHLDVWWSEEQLLRTDWDHAKAWCCDALKAMEFAALQLKEHNSIGSNRGPPADS